MLNIAVIPARGGSKRIPRKNIKLFLGKPMLAWSIEAAKKSQIFDRIIVSTDDDEIREIALRCGAEVPFLRPEHLSNDFVGTTEVIAHAAKWFISRGEDIGNVCCIYATAPFIDSDDLARSLALFRSEPWDFCFSVTDFAASVYRAFLETKEGGVEMLFPNEFATRSQDLKSTFHDAAQFYWGKPEAWIEGKKIFDANSKPYFIPRWKVQDIDTWDDWKRAEIMANSLIQNSV